MAVSPAMSPAMSPARLIALALLLAVLAALPALAQAFDQPALVSLATRIVIYAIAAASLNLALGYGGMVSFGHAAYFGIGGYVVAILFRHLQDGAPFLGFIPGTDQLLVTLPAAMLVGALLAALFGALALRTTGVQFIMITLAFAQLVFFFFVALKAYGGDDGLTMRRRNALFGLNMRDAAVFYHVCLAIAVAWFAILAAIVESPFGRILDAIRQNERRVAALGVAVYGHKLTAFVISGAGAALAGALFANHARFASPDMLHWTKSGELMMMVILGGVGTVFGPALGAAALIVLETVLASWTEHWQIILGPILVLIVLFGRGWKPATWLRRLKP
jgi:branched-chain amino acid transport system permease protein